jgi:hypothetical protein
MDATRFAAERPATPFPPLATRPLSPALEVLGSGCHADFVR